MTQDQTPRCSCTDQNDEAAPQSIHDSYLTPEEVVAALKGAFTTGTLRNHRPQRKGIRYILVGRSVLYPVSAVHEYLAAQAAAADDLWHDRD